MIKKEVAKWLLDVAKYLTTVFLLTSAFGDMDSWLKITGVVVGILLTFGGGVYLLYRQSK